MSGMKGKPDVHAFIAGGDALDAKKPATTRKSPPKKKPEAEEIPAAMSGEEKITKTFRLTRAMEIRLKEAAFRRSVAAGKRVTESDIIESALNKYLNK